VNNLESLCRDACRLKDMLDRVRPLSVLLPRSDTPPLCRAVKTTPEKPDLSHPLDFNTLLLAELALGEDLRNVRIHTGTEADALTRAAGAQALTGGDDIYFREGLYNPQSEEGRDLLIHELTHAARFARGDRPRFEEDRAEWEREAEGKENLLNGREWAHLERNSLAGETGEEPLIRIIGRAGQEYFLTEGELDEAKEQVQEELAIWLDREVRYYDEERRLAIMDRLFGDN